MKKTILLMTLAVAGHAFAATGKYSKDAANLVRYELISSCPANVTYAVDNTNIQQEQGRKSGWTKTYKASGFMVITSMNAQLTCKGKVTVNIYRGGKLIATATSTGNYAMAQASK